MHLKALHFNMHLKKSTQRNFIKQIKLRIKDVRMEFDKDSIFNWYDKLVF